MKSNFPILLTFIAIAFSTAAQQLPFLNQDDVNTSHYYYPNNGQIADFEGVLHPEVLYHSEFTFPKYYFQENIISFVSMVLDSINPDTVFRLDMEFYHPNTFSGRSGGIVAQDTGTNKMNYYFPHCGTGIEHVQSYQRLIYQNAFEDIDVEVTSNASGLKARFIVKPGGDPNQILLKFTGQDSVVPQLNGDLKMYLEQWDMDLRQAYAYQIDNNNQPYLLNWLPVWNHNGYGIVSVSTQGYDAGQPLIIELAGPGSLPSSQSIVPPYWCTYYGGIGKEENTDFIVGLDDELFTVSNVKGSEPSFPPLAGLNHPNNITSNVLVSRFNANDNRIFATYFGDSGDDYGTAIDYGWAHASYYDLFVVGSTSSTSLPSGTGSSNFNQANQNGIDGFISRFSAFDGTRKWSTFFGGNGDDFITDMKIDEGAAQMYICGYTTSNSTSANCDGSTSNFPLCNTLTNGYYQDFNAGTKDAFVGQFSTIDMDLEWCSYFGGDEDDYAYALEYNPVYIAPSTFIGNELFIVGQTSTNTVSSSFGSPVLASTLTNGEFPLANPGSGSYFQSQLGSITTSSNSDAFITRFSIQRGAEWSTFFGGNGGEKFRDISKNINGVFAVGTTSSSTSSSGTCTTNNVGEVPNCSSISGGYTQGDHGFGFDILITQFSFSGELKWATNYGENGEDGYLGVSCATDNLDNVYIISNSFPSNFNTPTNILTQNFVGQYYQDDNTHITENGYGTDNILMMFNADYDRIWVTYFGKGCDGCSDHDGDDIAHTITTSGSEWLYFGGYTYGEYLDVKDPGFGAYFDGVQGSTGIVNRPEDGYITKLYIANVATFLEELTEGGSIEFVRGYPNPTLDFTHILLPEIKSETVDVSIYNANGEQKRRFEDFVSSNELVINASDLSSGIYFVKIISQNSSYVYSFVKQ